MTSQIDADGNNVILARLLDILFLLVFPMGANIDCRVLAVFSDVTDLESATTDRV